jgi:hypothetical protein
MSTIESTYDDPTVDGEAIARDPRPGWKLPHRETAA